MDKFNWFDEVKNCKKNKDPFALHTSSLNPFEIKQLSNASNILYNGDLDEYFKEVKECDIGNQYIDILQDIYEEIKQLRSVINKEGDCSYE